MLMISIVKVNEINVIFIFQKGVVSGVLLVTPQTLMFNPSVSDHLVMDRGRDYYVIRLPLRALSMVTLYEDIAAMVTDDQSKR